MNYYNDNDPKVCAWLREMILAGELPPGNVDERSILDVKSADLTGYGQCHFFAGIGGWALALRWAGLEGVAGIWTGSCPCQPLSCAGKRQGEADERHLWPAFHGLIAKHRPSVVFGEQVASKDGREWFAGVRLDMEDLGYACGGADLCAAGVGAPHRRQRLFWVADANVSGRDQRTRGRQQPICDKDLRSGGLADMQRKGLEGLEGHGDGRREPGWLDAEAAGHAAKGGTTGRMADTADGRQRREPDGAEGRRKSGRDCSMGDSTGEQQHGGLGGLEAAQRQERNQFRGAGWSCFEVLPCRDGKARRVEAGTFPLADGLPGRMGLLRGYGNAIVPQVAETFIEAWKDARAGQGECPGTACNS